MLVGISCGLVATIVFHLIVRENRHHIDNDEKVEESRVNNKSKMNIRSWLVNPSLYFVASVYMATRLYVNLTQAYIPFYLQVSEKHHNWLLRNVTNVMTVSRTVSMSTPPTWPSSL